mmetsp:Transcript_12172/g.17641  ORF Transcript_12172/g.17641 Transcript_12172/m.17641 type:complete len:239 (-) Transcript_12172:1235-1951(-)
MLLYGRHQKRFHADLSRKGSTSISMAEHGEVRAKFASTSGCSHPITPTLSPPTIISALRPGKNASSWQSSESNLNVDLEFPSPGSTPSISMTWSRRAFTTSNAADVPQCTAQSLRSLTAPMLEFSSSLTTSPTSNNLRGSRTFLFSRRVFRTPGNKYRLHSWNSCDFGFEIFTACLLSSTLRIFVKFSSWDTVTQVKTSVYPRCASASLLRRSLSRLRGCERPVVKKVGICSFTRLNP